MQLGAFSLSLTVKDITVSQAFYHKLGFDVVGGESGQGWLILRNGTTTLGLFQGMFDKNTLTFNPGWDATGNPLADFTDVRQIQQVLKAEGTPFHSEADDSTTGPPSFLITDPDGNPILIDQHI